MQNNEYNTQVTISNKLKKRKKNFFDNQFYCLLLLLFPTLINTLVNNT